MRQLARYPRACEAARSAMNRTALPIISMNSLAIFMPIGIAGRTRHIYASLSRMIHKLSLARLALVQGVVTVLASGLSLLGVGAPEEMR